MSESINHIEYVNILVNFIKTLIPQDQEMLIYIDSPYSDEKPPRTMGNFVPDAYFCVNDLMIIGEAKTADDLDRRHSFAQLQDYYNTAVEFQGEAIILLCVPWFLNATAKNIYRRIKRNYDKDVKVYVVSEMGAEIV